MSKEKMYINFKVAIEKLNLSKEDYEKIIQAFCKAIGY